MIIAAVLTMIEVRIIKKMWIANKIDLIPWAVSFFGCFHKFETGIIGGTIASIVIILYRDLRPRIQINEIIDKREITFKLNGGLWYTGIEAFSEKVTQTLNASSLTPPFTVFIDCQNMFEIDYTVAQGLHQLIADLDANDISVEFINIESKHVMSVLEKTRVIDVACEVSGETVDSDVDICYETAV